MFRTVAVLLGLSVVPLTELALQWLNVGRNVNLIVPTATFGDKYSHQVNELADLAFYGATNLSGPEIRPFRLPKAAGTFRIVFVGASTVIGFPYPSELAFPRQVELLLQQQNPEMEFKSLNTGVTALNSFSVADLLEQSMDAEPDLIVVHAGHNEFYGPGGPASTAGQLPPALMSLSYRARRWRMVQLTTAGFSSGALLDDELTNVLPAQLNIPLDGEIYRTACENYRRNVNHMLAVCRLHGVPVLMTTVACNLSNQSPIRADWPDGASMDGRFEWEDLMAEAKQQISEMDFEQALQTIEQAMAICSDHALLQYRLGQSLAGLGRDIEAAAAFRKAKDLDGCRFRAPSEMGNIVRQLVQEQQHELFLDIEAQVAAQAHAFGPGSDFFLEHVHYNFHGHYVLSTLLAEYIQLQCLKQNWDAQRCPDEATLRSLVGCLPEDDLAAMLVSIQLLQSRTFADAADGQEHADLLGQRVAEIWNSLPEERQQAFGKLSQEQVQMNLIGALIQQHSQQKDSEFVDQLRAVQAIRFPWAAVVQ